MRFSSHGVRPAEAPGKKKKKSQADARAGPRVASPAARFNGSRSPRARSHQQAPCRDPNTESELAIASRIQFQSLPFLHIKQWKQTWKRIKKRKWTIGLNCACFTFRCMIYASKWRTDVLVHTSSNLALVLYLHFMISCFYDPCLTSSLSGPTIMLILFLRVIKNFYLHNNQFCWKKQKTLLKIIEGTLDHHSKTTSGKSIYIVRKHKPQWIHFSLLIPPHWLFYSFAFC